MDKKDREKFIDREAKKIMGDDVPEVQMRLAKEILKMLSSGDIVRKAGEIVEDDDLIHSTAATILALVDTISGINFKKNLDEDKTQTIICAVICMLDLYDKEVIRENEGNNV